MQLSETKHHYKMYKQGKMWVIMGLSATFLLAGAQTEVLAASEPSQEQTTMAENVTAISEATLPVNAAEGTSQDAVPSNDSATNQAESSQAESKPDEAAAAETHDQSPDSQPSSSSSANQAPTTSAQAGSDSQKPVESAASEEATHSAASATSEGTDSESSTEPVASEASQGDKPAELVDTTPGTVEIPSLAKPAEADKAVPDAKNAAANQVIATELSRTYPQADIDINTWMPDKNFQQVTLWVINHELDLGLTNVNQITQAMMSQLKMYFITTEYQQEDRDFYFAVMNTVSLKGFEYATNVERFWFTADLDANDKWQDEFVIYGKLKDISALKGLDNLTEINVQLNDIEDISALAGLHLTSLSLSYNHIFDFSPLASSLPTLSTAVTIAFQKVVLKDTVTLDIDPKTGKLVTSSFAFGKDKTHNLSITPVAGSDADGTNLTDTTIEWTNFKQSGYLKYQWHDDWMGAQGYPCDGYVFIPFYIENDGSGSIQIEFVDEQGQHLGSDVYINNWLDDTYDVGTDQQVLDRLQALKDQHYGIKTIQGSPNWTASKEMGHLVYVLAPIRPSVEFQVVDETGKPIPDVTVPNQQGEFDGEWQATVPTIPGYELVAATENGQALTVTNGQLTGKFSGEQTIKLVYRLKSQHATIHFEYEDGRSAGADVQLTGKHGDLIEFPGGPVIPGYFADDVPVAYYQDGDNHYTIIYRRAGQVTVQYVDEAGNAISDNEDLSGKVGSEYQTQPKEIAGYTLVKQPANPTGQFSESVTTVVYQYLKDAVVIDDGQPVTVQYVDETGQTIAAAETLAGKLGETYTTTARTIAGYELVKVVGNQNGTFGDQAQTVKFVYRQLAAKKGTVTIQYVDEAGREIAKGQALTGEAGQSYQTEALTIAGYRLKQTVGQTTGNFSEDDATLTFIYEQIGHPGQTGGGTTPAPKPAPDKSGSNQTTTNVETNQNADKSELSQVPANAEFKQVSNSAGTNSSAASTTRPLAVTKPVSIAEKTEPTAKLQPLSRPEITTATELPQTGEQRLNWFTVLGTCLLGLVAYVAGRKRV